MNMNQNQNNTTYDNQAIQFFQKDNKYILMYNDFFNETETPDFIQTQLVKDLINADKNKELHIFINSPGGSINTLLQLTEFCKQFKYIVTICNGAAYSAGFYLWSLGQERYTIELAEFLYHGIGWGSFSNRIENIKKEAELIAERSINLLKYYNIDFLTISEEKEGQSNDVFFLGKELIKRKAALPYDAYLNRMDSEMYFDKRSNNYYIEDKQNLGTYFLYKKTKISKTLSQINGFKK